MRYPNVCIEGPAGNCDETRLLYQVFGPRVETGTYVKQESTNPGLRGVKPATNRLSYGTALGCYLPETQTVNKLLNIPTEISEPLRKHANV